MATSGTTDFNLAIDDLVEEAFERCGMRMTAGYRRDHCLFEPR
jgi:hypothetical protein